MRFEEFSKDGATELDKHVLHLSQASMTLRLGQDAKTNLHSLNVITIGAHSRDLALLRLMLLEECTDYEHGVHGHRLESQAQIALRLHGKFGQRDSQATRQIVILSVDKSAS